MIKKNINNILYLLACILLVYWWYSNYRAVNYNMYHVNNGIIDTTEAYVVAPRYVNKITNGRGEKVVQFYNVDGEFIVTIKEDSLNNYILKKIK